MDLIWGHISPEPISCPELKNISLTLWVIQKTSFWFSRHVFNYNWHFPARVSAHFPVSALLLLHYIAAVGHLLRVRGVREGSLITPGEERRGGPWLSLSHVPPVSPLLHVIQGWGETAWSTSFIQTAAWNTQTRHTVHIFWFAMSVTTLCQPHECEQMHNWW